MRKKVVKLLSRYIRAIHPQAQERDLRLKRAKAYWNSIPRPERGRYRKKLEALTERSEA